MTTIYTEYGSISDSKDWSVCSSLFQVKLELVKNGLPNNIKLNLRKLQKIKP